MKDASDMKVEVITRRDREPGCFTANGFLTCRCGKCKAEDYILPTDFIKQALTPKENGK